MNHQSTSSPSAVTGDLVVIQRNPTSGTGKSHRALLELVRALRFKRFSVRMFSNRGRLDEFIEGRHVNDRLRCIVAAGGDGTVSSLVNRHPNRAIALLPMGTENLIARHLKMPCNGSVVAEVIQNGRIKRFDTAKASNHRFLLMASAGIDAEVVRRLHATRSGHIRRWTYIRPILQTFASYRYPEITVTDVDTGKSVAGSHVIVSNFREYGFHLRLTPDADPTDGQLDICVFRRHSLSQTALHAVCSLFRAQSGPHVVRFRSQHISLSGSRALHSDGVRPTEIPLQTDGDTAGELPIDIRIDAAAMQVLVHPP